MDGEPMSRSENIRYFKIAEMTIQVELSTCYLKEEESQNEQS